MLLNNTNQEEIIVGLLNTFEPIESEVVRIMGNRAIFREIIEISKNNSKINKNNSFWDFLKESYVALMVSAVGRQIDTNPDSSSLINFLNRILEADVTTSLTKEWYSRKYHTDDDIRPGFMEGIGKSDFEGHFGIKDFVDPDIIRADLEKLIEATKIIKRFRNKRIAHRDSDNKLVFGVNFNTLDKAIETIREITSKYYLLLKQGENDLVPIDQTDWQGIFTIPWTEKNDT